MQTTNTGESHHPAARAKFREALLALDLEAAKRCLLEPAADHPVAGRIEHLVVPVLEQMGSEWEQGHLALSQIYMAGRMCEELVDLILPPASPQRRRQPRLAVAVLEDYHLLGKRMVHATLRASGFEVLDYGRMEVEGLATRSQEDRVEILLVSTLMLPSALRVKALVERLKAAATPIQVVVGGAPFRYDRELWKAVGASATGLTAGEAVPILHRLAGGTL